MNKRYQRIAAAFVAASALLFIASPASGASVHLKYGKHAAPIIWDNGMTLTTAGALAGLGNGDIRITLTATGDVTATCTNPSGHNQPPGQNPAPVTVTGVQGIPASAIKNGTVAFSVTTIAPVVDIVGAPDCPNPLWTEAIDDVSFTSATITVEQPVGNVVLSVNCTFNPATSNGPVPSGHVSCG